MPNHAHSAAVCPLRRAPASAATAVPSRTGVFESWLHPARYQCPLHARPLFICVVSLCHAQRMHRSAHAQICPACSFPLISLIRHSMRAGTARSCARDGPECEPPGLLLCAQHRGSCAQPLAARVARGRRRRRRVRRLLLAGPSLRRHARRPAGVRAFQKP